MDAVTRDYLDALDRTRNGPTHQDRSVGVGDLAGVLERDRASVTEVAELQEELAG